MQESKGQKNGRHRRDILVGSMASIAFAYAASASAQEIAPMPPQGIEYTPPPKGAGPI
jgi:hypothetical protein